MWQPRSLADTSATHIPSPRRSYTPLPLAQPRHDTRQPALACARPRHVNIAHTRRSPRTPAHRPLLCPLASRALTHGRRGARSAPLPVQPTAASRHETSATMQNEKPERARSVLRSATSPHRCSVTAASRRVIGSESRTPQARDASTVNVHATRAEASVGSGGPRARARASRSGIGEYTEIAAAVYHCVTMVSREHVKQQAPCGGAVLYLLGTIKQKITRNTWSCERANTCGHTTNKQSLACCERAARLDMLSAHADEPCTSALARSWARAEMRPAQEHVPPCGPTSTRTLKRRMAPPMLPWLLGPTRSRCRASRCPRRQPAAPSRVQSRVALCVYRAPHDRALALRLTTARCPRQRVTRMMARAAGDGAGAMGRLR